MISARIHTISLPFRFAFAHATYKRESCDSHILEITDGTHTGYGEILIREYVTGLPNPQRPLIDSLVDLLRPRLAHIADKDLPGIPAELKNTAVRRFELPLLCGLETAFLELECRREGIDIYDLLGREPLRDALHYGIILPVLPPEKAEEFLRKIRRQEISNLRLKLLPKTDYNYAVLELARNILGPDARIVVDANSSWSLETACRMLFVCEEMGVRHIEDPVRLSDMPALAAEARGRKFVFIADESFNTEKDLEEIGRRGLFGMLNFRLAKNGGILRILALEKKARRLGLDYCLGCHVGETGILSAAGRVAASLLERPSYVEGSYDSLLLETNITNRDFDFGRGGTAAPVRGNAVGFTVDAEKLNRGTVVSREI